MRTSTTRAERPVRVVATWDPIVRVRGLVRHFADIRALDGVDLDMPPGVVTSLLGPNGAGKTTLIRILTTLLRPDQGEVVVAGVDVVADPTTARTRIGMAGQFAAVDEFLTGRENVEMIGQLYGLSRRDAGKRADRVLEGIGLADSASRRVGTYSGGMRRRLDLATSLVGRPLVMFLDEPTTGIDPRSRLDVWSLIRELVDDGTTVLLTTQYLDEADQLADRIAVIDEGRIVSEGTADQLKDALGGSVLEVGVNEASRERAAALLAQIAGEPARVDRSGTRLRIPARDESNTLLEAVKAFEAAGMTARELTLERPTLDDVFLALTDRTDPEPSRPATSENPSEPLKSNP